MADSFAALWADLEPVGREPSTGGYRRFSWTDADLTLREWFAGAAAARGLAVEVDRSGNQWAWWGDPSGSDAVVTGSHLDSVPDGGAYDGPLGVVSALAAVESLRGNGFVPARPLAVVNMSEEEGARFGLACLGSRLLTGAIEPDRALALRDSEGIDLADAMRHAGFDPGQVAAEPDRLSRIGSFVELHVEQGLVAVEVDGEPVRGLTGAGRAVGVASEIWPHGRWRVDIAGRADHAGTTALADRDDPMLTLAGLVLAARDSARRHDALATIGKLAVRPNAVNAIPSSVTAWLDARGADEDRVRETVASIGSTAGVEAVLESWTGRTGFDAGLSQRVALACGGAPLLPTGAGHDAGVLAAAGVPADDAVRPQPDRRLALARRTRGDSGLRGWGHRADRGAERPARWHGVTAYWCETAWLAGGPVDAVRVLVDDEAGLITEVTAGAPLRAGDHRLDGVVMPGFANAHSHAFHRALRGSDPRRQRHVLDLAGGDVPGRGHARSGLLSPAGDRGVRRDGAGRRHLRRGVPLPAPSAGRGPLRRPQRDGACPARCRRRRGGAADAARRLLPAWRAVGQRGAAAAGPDPATVRRYRRRGLGATG